MNDRRMVRVLSIDGGGIRGYLPALVLAEIERRAQRPVVELFDLVVGTSTGGIIGIGLATGMDASVLAEFYPRYGGRIFGWIDQPAWKTRLGMGRSFSEQWAATAKIGAIFGGNPRFPQYGGNARHRPAGLESSLLDVLGDQMLSEATVDLAVTSFDGYSARPVIFSRHDALRDPTYDLPLREVARATSAAPTFFPPLEKTWGGVLRSFVDGGVWANNPSGVALVESLRLTSSLGLNAQSVFMVSLGTGISETEPVFAGTSSWIGSAGNMIATATSVREGELLVERALPQDRIARLQVVDTRVAGAMDDPSTDRLTMLKLAAESLIATSSKEIDRIIGCLVDV